jgi:ParB family chromosome partitioning protein|tara:strand:- start:494 stop:1453 length:960 start_codon:yes stop_codon:yes gene_type:complete
MSRPLGGLGRGLEALIPKTEDLTDNSVPLVDVRGGKEIDNEEFSFADTAAAFNSDVYKEIELLKIRANSQQPRKHFDNEALEVLRASIIEFGILQPVVVRAIEPAGYFELVAGERRWRAAQLAGLSTIPAIVKVADDEATLVQALVENIHRQDLNAIEEASAFKQLLEDFGVTHNHLGEMLSKGRATITNSLRLLQLPLESQKLIVSGELSAGHGRALLGTDDPLVRKSLTRQAIKKAWSVRKLENEVKKLTKPADKSVDNSKEQTTVKNASFLEVEENLSEHFSTTVSVHNAGKNGKLEITFATLSDLERIYDIILPK